MASEEIVINETLSGRLYNPPAYLVLSREGRLRVPEGSVFDFTAATDVKLPGIVLTTIQNNILAQIPPAFTLTGNLIHQGESNTATNSTSGAVLASNTSNITGGVAPNDAFYCNVQGSTGSNVLGNCDRCFIAGCENCTVNNYHNAAGLLWSTNSTITGTASFAAAKTKGIIGGSTCSMSGLVDRCGILFTNGSQINGTSTGLVSYSCIAGGLNNLISSSAASSVNYSFIGGGSTNTITTTGIGSGSNGIIASLSNTLTGGTSIFTAGCQACSTTNGVSIVVIGCINCSASDGNQSGVYSASGSSMINSIRSVIMTGTNHSVDTCTSCFVGGPAVSMTGRNNCFCWGGAATANNQAVLGVNTRVTGSGNNVSVEAGYLRSTRGVVSPYRSSGVSTTLALDDTVLNLTSGTITLPLASTFGANYPLDTVINFRLMGSAGNVIVTTAPDVFNLVTGWTQHAMSFTPGAVDISLVNRTTTPYWRFNNPVPVHAQFQQNTPNFFGLLPPKSDANQLPTSTSEANHYTLSTTAFYTWDGFYYGNSNFQSQFLGNGTLNCMTPLTSIQLPEAEAEFTVESVSGGGNFRLRADLCSTATLGSLPGSYVEIEGRNDQFNARTIILKGYLGQVVPPNVGLALRISQDSTLTINASASIQRAKLRIKGFV